MIDRNHPAVKAAHFASLGKSTVSGQTWADALAAALPHLESATPENIARLRDTPAGKQLMREAAVNARSPRPHWNSTPDGTIYDAHLPGDEMRARNLDARRREVMLNMRESDEGRALMAEGWEARHKARADYSQGHDDDCMGWEDCHCGRYVNPYRT